jgi:hypothetical protein
MENTHYWQIQSATTRRRKIGLRIWYWVSGGVTVLSVFFAMLFTLMPSLLVVSELAAKAVPENVLLGVVLSYAGLLLCFVLMIRLVEFQFHYLYIERWFIILFVIFWGAVSLDDYYSNRPISITALTTRYSHRINNVVSIYKDFFSGYGQEIYEQSNYTTLDSLALDLKDHYLMNDFISYASNKHFKDKRADLNSVMSLYLVFLNEFDVLNVESETDFDPEPSLILFLKAGNHFDLTVFLAACLMHYDYPVHIRENLQGRLMVEVRIDAESYYQLESLLNGLRVYKPSIVWYINEFAIYNSAYASVTIPLYLPVTSQEQERHFKFNDNEDTIVKLASMD